MRNKTIPFLVAALLGGCGGSIDNELSSSASSQAVESTTLYPSVVMIALPNGIGMCSGTFISPRAVLTAAHCAQSSGAYTVYTSFGAYMTGTKELLGAGNVADTSDLALLVFSSDVADPAQARVTAMGTMPSVGDTVRIVGFGCDDLNTSLGAGVKRTGTNKISAIDSYLELLSAPTAALVQSRTTNAILGPSNEAGSCFGDSGGPMLQTQNDQYKLVGVTHAGGWEGSLIASEYINLNRSENMAFLESMDQKYSLHLFDGCWTSSDADACSATTASLKIFGFLKPMLTKFFGWLFAW